MSKAQKAFSVGGVGAQPALDDVVKVAYGLTIALDNAGSERIKKESPAPKSFEAEVYQPSAAEPGQLLTAEQARAVIIVKLLAIMNGKSSMRLQVADYLAGLLNNNVLPKLPVSAEDETVLSALADACQTEGAAAMAGALQSAGISAPTISSNERVILRSGASASAGIGALTVQAGRTLLSTATAVAALSCEAFGAQVRTIFLAILVTSLPGLPAGT
jgi:histidine ammonia-lyase